MKLDVVPKRSYHSVKAPPSLDTVEINDGKTQSGQNSVVARFGRDVLFFACLCVCFSKEVLLARKIRKEEAKSSLEDPNRRGS